METLRVSYSSLGTFDSCARKFEFNKLYPRRERDDSYAADVGKALHAGYQSYLTHGDQEQAIWEFMMAFPYEGEYQQSNDYRSFEAALATLEEMFISVRMNEYQLAQIKRPLTTEEHAANQIVIDARPKGIIPDSYNFILPYDPAGIVVPAIEVPFEIRFKGFSIPPCRRFPEGASLSVIGYIDAIMQHHLTQGFRTLDIKTSRDNVLDATGKYRFDGQQVPYGIVVDHVAQGIVESFEVLYLHCYIDLVSPRVQLYPFAKTQTDVREWCTNKILQFQRIAKFCATDYFPRTETGCMFYQRPCQYLEACQTRDPEVINMIMLMGENAAEEKPFFPWIVADVDIEG